MLAALAASSCCVGPLLLAALGLGGAGAAGAVGAFRPHLLVVTAAMLAVGFYFSYRKRGRDACGCERPRANRAGRVAMWITTVAVVLVASAPSVLARWADRPRRLSPAALAAAGLARADILVVGVDCQACAAPMRRALAKVGGLHDLELDLPKQSVTVTYEPRPGRLEAYLAAIDELGYEASLPTPSVDSRSTP